MAKIWKEPLDPEIHREFIESRSDGGELVDLRRSDGWVYFVRECSFTFQFTDRSQIRVALDFFRSKTHPSSREENPPYEHHWQRWFERLPKGLSGGTKRERIVRALDRACRQFEL
ncbi:MAG: hypothetical protein AAFQ82_07845 [Myxococcota bacterium]